MKKLIFMLIFSLLIAGQAFAADGDEFSTTSFRVDSNGEIYQKELWETATTDDTVTVAESGKHFFPNISSGTIAFTLPTAARGLTYKFTSINGNGVSGQGTVILNPQSTDTFVACVNSSTTSTFTAGDDLDSPQATGDSVRITGTSSSQWVCSDRIGTWVDGN